MRKNDSVSEIKENLINSIENGKNIEVRLKSIEELRKIGSKDQKLYNTLETWFISDESVAIRASAARFIIDYYLEEGASAILWSIRNDKSLVIIKTLYYMSTGSNDPTTLILRNELENVLAETYGVYSDEAKFLLDLESICSTHEKIGFITPGIEKRHVKDLDLAGLDLSHLPSEIGNLSELKRLNLWNNNLSDLPRSFEKLQNLEALFMDWNNFTTLPKIDWSKLKSLRKLSLTNNPISLEVPDSLYKLINSNFSEKYVKEGVTIDEAEVLGLLEILTGRKINKQPLEQKALRLNSCDYKVDPEGHVYGIYLYGNQGFQINAIPKDVFNLINLKELVFRNQNVRIIPDEIRNLTVLLKLDLMDNKIPELPESLKYLKRLGYLDLGGNLVEKLPDFLKSPEIDVWF